MNREELWIGWIFGMCFFPIVGFWALLLAPATALLWALSGMNGQSKLWRRLVCMALPCPLIFWHTHHLSAFYPILPAFAVQCIGYGIPTVQPPDEGSALGRFWTEIYYRMEWAGASISGREPFAHVCTRATIYLLLALSYSLVFIR